MGNLHQIVPNYATLYFMIHSITGKVAEWGTIRR